MVKSRRITKRDGIAAAVQLLKTIARNERRIVASDKAAPPVPEVAPTTTAIRRENEDTIRTYLDAFHDHPQHARAGFAFVLADHLLSVEEGGVMTHQYYLSSAFTRGRAMSAKEQTARARGWLKVGAA